MFIVWNYVLKMDLNINEMSYYEVILKEKIKILIVGEMWFVKF